MGLQDMVNHLQQTETRDEIPDLIKEQNISFYGKSEIGAHYFRVIPYKEDAIAKAFNTITLALQNSRNEVRSIGFNAAYPFDNNDKLVQAVRRWGKRTPTPWNHNGNQGQGFGTNYFLNVIEYQFNQQTRQLEPEMDSTGNYFTRILQLSYSQYNALQTAIQEPMNNPANSQMYQQFASQFQGFKDDGWGPVSTGIAYPICLQTSKSNKGSGNEYSISVYTGTMLPPLNVLQVDSKDLDRLATPAVKIKPGVVDWAIDQIDKRLGFATTTLAPQAGQAPAQGYPAQGQQQAPVQGNFNQPQQGYNQPAQGFQGTQAPQGNFNQAPAGVATGSYGQPQAPVQPSFGTSTSTTTQDANGNFNGAPSASSLGFTSVDTKQGAKAPQSPASPVDKPADPFASNGTSIDISDDDLPF